jgi:oligosaccharyl transferase (archaeosortase A-associated)
MIKDTMSNLSAKIANWLWIRRTYAIPLFFIFIIALVIRIVLPYNNVLGGDWVRFAETDPWYHMRIIENLVHHFPYRIAFDPYTYFPHGQSIAFAPFFDLLVAFFAWVIGLGSPTQHTLNLVGAYSPAVLGALVIIPVYFIGKELFSRKAGLFSAALVAILPGELLTHTLLGDTDHHVGEILFSTITALFFILALKKAKEKDLTFDRIRNKEWRNIRKPLIYAALTGIALGLYCLTWVGALLFVLILFSSILLLYIIDHLRGKSTDYLCIIGVPIFLIALIMITPFLNQILYNRLEIASLTVALLGFVVLSGVSRVMTSRKIKPPYYLLALAVLGLVGLGLFRIADASLYHSMWSKFSVFRPNTSLLTVAEARPLFEAYGPFSLSPAWGQFTTGLIIAPIALILILYAVIKKASAEKIFLLVWSVVMIVATIGQIRFSYYLTVNVALLGGYFCWMIPGWISGGLHWLGLRESGGSKVDAETKEKLRKEKKRKARARRKGKVKAERRWLEGVGSYLKPKYASGALSVLIVFFLAFYPNIRPAIHTARQPSGPTEDWHTALVWMRDNTPDPFQDPAFFYERYEKPADGENYNYPQSAYGVMSWWDYGHWITDIAHRIPIANPFQAGAVDAAQYLLSQNETLAEPYRLGSKYVIIDTAMITTIIKFYAMPVFAGQSVSQYYEIYYMQSGSTLTPVVVYYPAYYQTMVVRLYNFAGQEVTPSDSTWVIQYTGQTTTNGYKIISGTPQMFHTYEEAEAYIASQSSPSDYRIVGNSPFASPVPLEKLEHYTLIHQSPTTVVTVGERSISNVEIFEYTP